MQNTKAVSKPYLVVDLDGTLIRTDLLYEQIAGLLKASPSALFLLPYWLVRGKAGFKAQLALRAAIDPASLPYSSQVLEHIHAAKKAGLSVVLASASHEIFVRQVAAHLGIFDSVLFSTASVNLRGKAKLSALRTEFGGVPFHYIGDSAADLPLWQEAAKAIVVNPSTAFAKRVRRAATDVEVLQDDSSGLGGRCRALLRQLRLHQWSKNTLVFLPVIAAHQFRVAGQWQKALLTFAAFCLLASAIYVLNDLCDLPSDRNHPVKRQRPLASGALPIQWGLLLLPLLLGAASLLASLLPGEAALVLGIYAALNVAYSTRLKKALILDVVILAVLYNCRMWAGGAATSIPISTWLLSFATFFFFGLALVKRYTELVKHGRAQTPVQGRGYSPQDAGPVLALGVTSSFLSVLVLVLYFNSGDIQRLYAHVERLWLVVPTMLYWLSRLWILAHRGEVDDDPVAFALSDRATWAVGFLLVAALFVAL